MEVRLNLRTVTVSSEQALKQEAVEEHREHIMLVQKESQQEPTVDVHVEQEKHDPRLYITRKGKPESVLQHRKPRRTLQRKCSQNAVVDLQGKWQREPMLNGHGEGQRNNSLCLQGKEHEELKLDPQTEGHQEDGAHLQPEGQRVPGLPGQGQQESGLHQQGSGQEESGRGVRAKGRLQHTPVITSTSPKSICACLILRSCWREL